MILFKNIWTANIEHQFVAPSKLASLEQKSLERASTQNKLEVGEPFEITNESSLEINEELKVENHQGDGINGEAATIDKVETYPHM